MSLSTYADLQTAVSNWLKRSDLSSYTPDLILLGEKWIFRHARVREMESALSVAISSGTATVPADFIALKHARLSTSPATPLDFRPASWIYANNPNRSAGEIPKFIGVDGETFIFGPSPGAYTVQGIYYAEPTSIQSSANAVFVAYPDLYLFAALAEAEPFLKNDARVALWVAKRDGALIDINKQTKESRQGDAMSVRIG
jgi:hypothetical protein